MRSLHFLTLGCALAVLAGASARAGTINLTFDELPADTPANGAAVSGARFSFTGPFPGDAFYNSSTLRVGPGDASALSGAVLEGDSAGILTIDFDTPTSMLGFAVLLSTTESLPTGFTVTLFDSSLTSLGATAVATAPGATTLFSEGVFQRFVGPEVRRVVIDFNDAPGRFALDNLQTVPAPGSFALAGVGAAALTGYGLLRRIRSTRTPGRASRPVVSLSTSL